MKKLIPILVLILAISSCCKTKECRCDLEDAYMNIEAQHWVEPLTSQEEIFQAISGEELILKRDYMQYIYCLGKDDCCTDYPYLVTDFGSDLIEVDLLHVTALKDDVEFSTTNGGRLGFLNVVTNELVVSADFNFILFDTIWAGYSYPAFQIENTELREGVDFTKMVYVKQVGIISFTDLDAVKWVKK